ncbi:N-acetylmuramoyl-L-alanine amidase [Caldalkalibacillus mannanilyticus]|uniref:N-acetylmuramoyl-L-alanine amidase n=1 Tax=Caldalkalibacillus mannanilyticus TaxID=1418 RepID=UPI000468EE14|nr:N-acetylmuramoyl-L-alanine amidase [Caldalkalibacillus mannanilyticus]
MLKPRACWIFTFVLCFQLLALIAVPVASATSGRSQAGDSAPEMRKLMLEYDVIIDIGHGGVDGGTFYQDLLEKDLNLAIGSKLYHRLRAQGYQVGVTRLQDYALSDDSSFEWIRSRHIRDLKQRWLIAETLKPKAFISIHINFSPLRKTRGPVILHQRRAESYLLAELLQDELNQLARAKKRTKATHDYYLLEKVTSPTLIAEVGYISHPSEREKLQSEEYQEHIAQKMADAVNTFFILYP